jgi:hypothetical protein
VRGVEPKSLRVGRGVQHADLLQPANEGKQSLDRGRVGRRVDRRHDPPVLALDTQHEALGRFLDRDLAHLRGVEMHHTMLGGLRPLPRLPAAYLVQIVAGAQDDRDDGQDDRGPDPHGRLPVVADVIGGDERRHRQHDERQDGNQPNEGALHFTT